MREIDPLMEGSGGGFGRYPGLTLTEIGGKLDKLAEEPSARSVSGVLRIAHEQFDARGGLGTYPLLAAGFAILGSLGLAMATWALPEKLQSGATGVALALLAMAAIIGFSAFRLRDARRASIYQERWILAAAGQALTEIAVADFARRPLDHRELLTLQRLVRRRTLSAEAAASILEVG